MKYMNTDIDIRNDEHIRCALCDEELVLRRVRAFYLKGEFPTRVLGCPVCGQIYISESLALDKMAEIERTQEEK